MIRPFLPRVLDASGAPPDPRPARQVRAREREPLRCERVRLDENSRISKPNVEGTLLILCPHPLRLCPHAVPSTPSPEVSVPPGLPRWGEKRRCTAAQPTTKSAFPSPRSCGVSARLLSPYPSARTGPGQDHRMDRMRALPPHPGNPVIPSRLPLRSRPRVGKPADAVVRTLDGSLVSADRHGASARTEFYSPKPELLTNHLSAPLLLCPHATLRLRRCAGAGERDAASGRGSGSDAAPRALAPAADPSCRPPGAQVAHRDPA
jgi:hypothetical protein